jgi:FkbM family methyltransferase
MYNLCKSLKDLGFEPRSILDIGAYHGHWSREIYKVYPDAHYTLIEAIDYPELRALAGPDPLLGPTVINCVLNDVSCTVDWYELRNTGDSMFKEKTGYFKDCTAIKKMAVTLDSLGLPCPDLIKIDTQGSEISVLKGALRTISGTSFMILEMPFMGQYNENAPTFAEYIKFMDDIGFVVYDIISMHRSSEETGLLFQIDMCFINKNHFINGIMQQKINEMGRTSYV